jgi:hypothetical protein
MVGSITNNYTLKSIFWFVRYTIKGVLFFGTQICVFKPDGFIKTYPGLRLLIGNEKGGRKGRPYTIDCLRQACGPPYFAIVNLSSTWSSSLCW